MRNVVECSGTLDSLLEHVSEDWLRNQLQKCFGENYGKISFYYKDGSYCFYEEPDKKMTITLSDDKHKLTMNFESENFQVRSTLRAEK